MSCPKIEIGLDGGYVCYMYSLFAGIMFSHYDSTFKSNHQLCLSILKQFGFGQRVMEARILMEVEEMINKLRERQGRPFDVRHMISAYVGNVMMSMLFGHRFDQSDPDFQQLLSDNHDGGTNFSMAIELFPVLRFLPYFKKLIANELRLVKNVLNFIDVNVAACTKVCHDSLNTVDFYCLMKYVESGLEYKWLCYRRGTARRACQ